MFLKGLQWQWHQSAMSRWYAIFCVHNFEVYGLTWKKYGSNKMEPQPTRQGFDDSCLTNVSETRSLAFRRCPMAPTLTRFICLRFISFFWVTSNQKCTFENLLQSMIWKFPFFEEIATVPQEMLINEMQNFEERLRTWVWQEGRHLSDIIFRNWVINGSNQNCIYYRLLWCWHNFFIMKTNKVTIIWKTCVLFAPHCIYDYLHICEILIECGMNERMNRWMNE